MCQPIGIFIGRQMVEAFTGLPGVTAAPGCASEAAAYTYDAMWQAVKGNG